VPNVQQRIAIIVEGRRVNPEVVPEGMALLTALPSAATIPLSKGCMFKSPTSTVRVWPARFSASRTRSENILHL
jgi:hypothetical protein